MTIDLENTGAMRLDRGAMQNWSDLDELGAPASPALRRVVADLAADGGRILVVGPAAVDLVTELAAVAEHLTVVTRSIPDAARYTDAMAERDTVDVVCGDIAHLDVPIGTYDVVLALADLSTVASLETTTLTWRQIFDAVVAHVAPGGRLALAVENELGLHRMTSLRSRYTSNDNGAWNVVATFDTTRPRTRAQLNEVLSDGALTGAQVADLLPTWDERTIVARGMENASPQATLLLESLTLASPALRRLGADPTRITRAAVLAGRVADMPSGWLVVAGAAPAAGASIIASTASGEAVTYREEADGLVEDEGRRFTLPVAGEHFGELALDACASGDAATFRSLVQQWWTWAQEQAVDGALDAAHVDLRFDNLMTDGTGFVPVVQGRTSAPVDLAAWTAICDFVAVVRARGSRHLWPAATDDRTMAATIGAMAGVPARDDLDDVLGRRETQLNLPAHDVSGLLAVIERLEEKNKALAARANWFENRLNLRERELRGRAKRQAAELALAGRQQEVLRKSAEDVRKSLTYRLGNVAMGPLKEAKKRLVR